MPNKASKSENSAFTLVELLALLSVISLLTLLCTAATTSSQSKSATATCLYNLRQLTRAWQMYADDYYGILPDNNYGSATVWAKQIVSYNLPESASPANVTNTPFGKYVGRAELFRCPADQSTTVTSNGRIERNRSYSMNAAVGAGNAVWLPSPKYRTYTNMASITAPSPSRLFVFIGEHPDSINDGSFAVVMPDSASTTQLIDFPASYHDLSAGLSYADGHVEMKRWIDSRTTPKAFYLYPNPDFKRPMANNPDVLWLADRTSARRQ